MRKRIVFAIIFKSRIIITFNLTFVKNEMNAEHSNAHASTINFYKNVNIHSYAILFFNTFLLFTIKRRKRGGNKNYYNNDNDENNEKKAITIKINETNKTKIEIKTKLKMNANSGIRISIIIFIMKRFFAKRASI